MKGLTHFMSGVAVSSFFAPAVQMAASTRSGIPGAEASFILLLGGLYGIMPDTLDFKLGQFFSNAEIKVDCDALHPNPQTMAEQIGEAMERAFETGKYVKAQLYPMRLGTNLWRQYMVKFDGEANEVVIVLNEVVSTSQVPFEGTAPPDDKRVGRYKLKQGKILETHGRPSVVDIMSGPQYGFYRDGDHVLLEFLPWHRTWSHSYVFGAMLSIPVFLAAFLLKLKFWYLYGLIAFLGFAIHLTEDLTGHMGGSLIWPFSAKRSNGFCLFRASNPQANFSIDFAAVVITIFNIDRFSTNLITMPWYLYFFLFLIIPLGIYFYIARRFGEKEARVRTGAVKGEKILQQQRLALQMEEILYEDESLPSG